MKSYYQLVRHNGNRDLFKAVELSIIALQNGVPLHIHAEGLRGTGKTTILRSVKELLPPIVRIKNCRYNCHPDMPHCQEHRYLSSKEILDIGTEMVPCPFLEISHAAKIGTVVGSIDLGKLTNSEMSTAVILPGTIPQAHRGVIFIDEINRLADTSPELADVLLDVMGTKPGHLQIEETGLSTVSLPISVSIWAASNPDEEPGSLNRIRRQLSDRFDFNVNMGRPNDYQVVCNILEKGKKGEELMSEERILKLGNLNNIVVEDNIRRVIAKIYVDFSLESLRAVETIEFAARLSCLLAGRQTVEVRDISQVIALSLAHRISGETITAILNYLEDLSNKSLSIENVASNYATNKLAENSDKINNAEKTSWWKNFINILWNKMKSPLQNTQNGSMGTSENGALSAGKIIDPQKTTITAPPRKAIPLKELPVEEFIVSEGNMPNDKK